MMWRAYVRKPGCLPVVFLTPIALANVLHLVDIANVTIVQAEHEDVEYREALRTRIPAERRAAERAARVAA